MNPRSRRGLVALLACLALSAAAGCVGMPEEGPVVPAGSEGSLDEPLGIFSDPRPPQPGEEAADIVAHFLDAMAAIPIQTTTARLFLTRDAQAAWNPKAETLTYDEATQPRGVDRVSVTLTGAERLDDRGSYRGRLPASERTLHFPMARENGEWRISEAPDATVVPQSWFDQVYTQVSLYFFDPTAQILVPEPVFVPRGAPLATALIDALLRGPGRALSRVSRTFIPPGLNYGLSVPISEEGVADLALDGFSGQLAPQASELMLAQLAWTLGQEPAIDSLRVTLGDQQVTLPGGVSLFSVDQGSEFDPTGLQASSLLYGLLDGLLVAGTPAGLAVVDGPMGTSDLGVRSIAVNLDASTVAGVAAAGDRVLLTSVRGPEEKVEQVVSGARNLRRPAWDFADRLWMVDDTVNGAEVSYLTGDTPHALTVRGVTGRNVSRFLVSRDGSRLVAVVRHPKGDRVVVSRILHDDNGAVIRATRAHRIAVDEETGLRIRDIGWSSPTSVAVLTRPGKDLSQVRTLSVDGAPSGPEDLLTRLRGRVLGLVSSPAEDESLYAVTTAGLNDLGDGSSATLDPGVTAVGYVG